MWLIFFFQICACILEKSRTLVWSINLQILQICRTHCITAESFSASLWTISFNISEEMSPKLNWKPHISSEYRTRMQNYKSWFPDQRYGVWISWRGLWKAPSSWSSYSLISVRASGASHVAYTNFPFTTFNSLTFLLHIYLIYVKIVRYFLLQLFFAVFFFRRRYYSSYGFTCLGTKFRISL